MKLCVIGCGYVGLTAGTCLAEIGHEVVCTDRDEHKIHLLQQGGIPIYEDHLEGLVHRNVAVGRLRFTRDVEEAITSSEAIFVCVGTPPDADGKANLVAVENVTRTIATVATDYKLVIGKSTVPVHTSDRIQKTLATWSHGRFPFDVVSNPEFLREGTGVYDFFHPDRIVVGVGSDRAAKLMRQIYEPVVEGNFECPCHGQPASGCGWEKPELLLTNVHSAELIKHAANSFLSLKISYANAIADLCELAGANADEVLRGIGLDHRIGREFLRPGIGFGGFCFPKDLSAFIQMASDLGYDFRLLREVQAINQARPEQFIRKVREELWVVQDKTIGVLGLAFKAGTDDTRLSPAYPVIRELVRLGARIRAYDPKAMQRACGELPAGIVFCNSAEEVAQGAEMILILTEWPEFRQANWEAMGQAMSRRLVLDGRNLFPPGALARLGFEYHSIGRSPERANDTVSTASS